MARTITFLVVLWISCVSSEIVKRAAIVSQTKSLDSDANDIDSIFVTKREKYYGRAGRTLNLNNETQISASDDNVESSRKASPDVQDIIDGIVKLLGGKVHQAPAQAPTPPQIPPSSYNLFNPTKPMGKPSRINNRGPPVLPDPRPPPQGNNRPLLVPENNNNHNVHNNNHYGQPIPQYHDRPHGQPQHPHPPPMLDNRPLDRQPMNDNRPHLDRSPTTEYRPMMFENQNQKPNRPPIVYFQDRPSNSEDTRPGTTFEAIPLELLTGYDNKTKLGPPFPLPTVGYKPVPVSAVEPFRQGVPLPEQLVPPKFGPPQNNNNWPKVPSPPTIPPLITEEPKIIGNNKEIKSETPLPTTKKPTSLLVPVQVQTTTPQPADIEDDEAEEDTVPIRLEPTIKDPVMEIEPTIVSSIDESHSLSVIASTPSLSTTSESPIIAPSSLSDLNSESRVEPTRVQEEPSLQPTSTTTSTTSTTTTTTTPTTFSQTAAVTALTSPTPPLRPGIVLNEALPHSKLPSTAGNQGFGSVEVVTAVEGHGQIGDIFDVTVTAKQHYGGQATGQPFVIPVDIKDDVITHPTGNQQFVSIDGKRQYFNLHGTPNTAAVVGSGSVTQTQLQINGNSNNSPAIGGLPSPIRPVSTTLNIAPNPIGNPANVPKGVPNSKMPPNLVRRPITRKPSVPPVRIDTCIVGDDSTCNADQFEICRTESGVSSCLCRAGYARRRHREPCKAVVSMVLSMRLDKLGDKKLKYDPDYFNPNSELYQTLEWETIHAMDTALVDTNLHGNYVGTKLDAIGFDGRHAVVNSTVLIQENPKMNANQVKRELQRQLVQSITRNRNNFGKSQLWVEGPISAVAAITDVNECENPDLNDCDERAKCVNTFGSFECKCEPGYGDHHEKDRRLSGRKCETCSGKSYCNGRGECAIEKGQRVCKCSGNYYGSQCDIDGEVLAVAIGASVSAIVIIGLTLACLCMWSRRWKREEQKAAVISRTLFGGMASQALSYLSKNTMNSSNNPYQQHVTMDDRLRWAQVADTNLNGNIYVQNEPMSLCSGPTMMDTRRSAETLDTTVDDIFDMDRHPTKRPRSRSSQMQTSGIYYDLEPQSEMYASSPMVPFPAQFCVPSMNPYVQRGYYN